MFSHFSIVPILSIAKHAESTVSTTNESDVDLQEIIFPLFVPENADKNEFFSVLFINSADTLETEFSIIPPFVPVKIDK